MTSYKEITQNHKKIDIQPFPKSSALHEILSFLIHFANGSSYHILR